MAYTTAIARYEEVRLACEPRGACLRSIVPNMDANIGLPRLHFETLSRCIPETKRPTRRTLAHIHQG